MVFMQMQPPTGPVLIQGNVTGLPTGKHGVHIHEAGDIRTGCENVGAHFNPYFVSIFRNHFIFRMLGEGRL